MLRTEYCGSCGLFVIAFTYFTLCIHIIYRNVLKQCGRDLTISVEKVQKFMIKSNHLHKPITIRIVADLSGAMNSTKTEQFIDV